MKFTIANQTCSDSLLRYGFLLSLLSWAALAPSVAFAQTPELDYKLEGTKAYYYEGTYERGNSTKGIREKFFIKLTPLPVMFDPKEIMSESMREVLTYDQTGVLPTSTEPIFGCLSWPVDGAGASYRDDQKTSRRWGQIGTRALVTQPDLILALRLNTRNSKKWSFARHVQHLPTGNPNENEKKRSGIFSMIEAMECEFESIQRNLATIKFKYDLRSREAVEGHTVEAAYGTGTYIFDVGSGLIQSFRFKGHHVNNYEDAKDSANLKIALNFVKMEETVLPDTRREKNRKPASRTDMSGFAYTQAIERITSKDPIQRRDSILAFYRFDANLSKEDGAEALMAAFPALDSNEKYWCASALGHWTSSKSQGFLEKLLKDADINVRLGAMDGLLQIKGEEAAKAACSLLADEKSALAAHKLLVTIGTPAETGLLTILDHKDAEARKRGCQALALVGTKISLTRLAAMKEDKDKAVILEAESAVRKIKERLAAK